MSGSGSDRHSPPLASRPRPDYEAAKRRALARCEEIFKYPIPSEKRGATLAERLIAVNSRPQRVLLLRNLAVADRVGVARKLMSFSTARRSESMNTAERISMRALEVALSIPIGDIYRALAYDIRAETRAYLANIRRLQGHFAEAQQLWRRVREEMSLGTQDLELEGRLLDLEASLLRALGRLDEAATVLEGAASLQEEHLGDRHAAGRSLLKLASVRQCQGRLREALELTVQGGRWIDPRREPVLGKMVAFNLTLLSSKAIDRDSVFELIEKFRPLFEDQLAELPKLRIEWLEVMLVARQGGYRDAVAPLRRIMDRFVQIGRLFDAVLVGLELSLLHLAHGQHGLVYELAETMQPLFESPSIPAVAGASLRFYHRSVSAGTITEAQLAALIPKLNILLPPPSDPPPENG